MPVATPSALLQDYLAKLPSIPQGLYVEPGINGNIMLSVYDDQGTLIRKDFVAYEHFDADTLAAAEEWMESHRQHRDRVMRSDARAG